jgi:hypothetical protein
MGGLTFQHWYYLGALGLVQVGRDLTKWIGIEGKTNLVYLRDLSFYATR